MPNLGDPRHLPTGQRLPGLRFGYTGTRMAAREPAFTRAAQELAYWLVHALPNDATVIVGGAKGMDCIIGQRANARGLHVHTILPAPGPWDRDICQCWREHSRTWEQLYGGTPLDRDDVVVARADWLVGVPMYPEAWGQSRRSGTWATIRRARKAGKTDDTSIYLLGNYYDQQQHSPGSPPVPLCDLPTPAAGSLPR